MAKDTLLEIVQSILSDADGDEVNSISDTIESDQVARVIRNEFYDIVDNYDIEHTKTLTKLTASSSATPCLMTRPEGFHQIEWVKYDKRLTAGGDPDYEYVKYLLPEEFLEMSDNRTASNTDISQMTLPGSTHVLNIKNDQAPTYWTILENYDSLIFDSYNSSLETNLQASKSLAYGIQRPTLSLTDGAIPDLPQNLMQLLKNRSRAMYFDLFKDGVSREVDRRRRNSEVRQQRLRHVVKNYIDRTGPDYGRKR